MPHVRGHIIKIGQMENENGVQFFRYNLCVNQDSLNKIPESDSKNDIRGNVILFLHENNSLDVHLESFENYDLAVKINSPSFRESNNWLWYKGIDTHTHSD